MVGVVFSLRGLFSCCFGCSMRSGVGLVCVLFSVVAFLLVCGTPRCLDAVMIGLVWLVTDLCAGFAEFGFVF